MNEKELWLGLLLQCRGKYICANELLRLTQELGEAVNRDDKVSIQLQLVMRQDEIDKIRKYEEKICILLEAYPSMYEQCKKVMSGDYDLEACMTEEEKAVAKVSQDLKSVVKRTVEIDKIVNQKIAGDRSFYAMK